MKNELSDPIQDSESSQNDPEEPTLFAGSSQPDLGKRDFAAAKSNALDPETFPTESNPVKIQVRASTNTISQAKAQTMPMGSITFRTIGPIK
jgi:hypothetical protein